MAKKPVTKNEETEVQNDEEPTEDTNQEPMEDTGEEAGEEAGEETAETTGTTELATREEMEAQMLAEATEAAKIEASGDPAFIATRGGVMSVGDTAIPGNKFLGIIVAATFENLYYDTPFRADNIVSPVCFAQALTEGELRPGSNVKEKQSVTCDGCPNDQWGSADVGRGKKCGNYRKIAVIKVGTYDENEKTYVQQATVEGVIASEILYFKVPPTSLTNYSKYVTGLTAQHKKPPHGVVTEISLVPDKTSQFKLNFNYVEDIGTDEDGVVNDDAALGIFNYLTSIRYKIQQFLLRPYQYDDQAAPAKSDKY